MFMNMIKVSVELPEELAGQQKNGLVVTISPGRVGGGRGGA